MENPFRYGIVVDEPYFIDREEEMQDIEKWLKSRQSLMIYSPRRYGKTSLILKILKNLSEEGFNTVYLDFYKVHSRLRFAELYYEEIIKAMPSWDKAVQKISTLVRAIKPVLSFSQDGTPSFGLQLNDSPEKLDLSEVFDLPQKLAGEKPWIIVFDEFQDINKLNGENFEKEMRASLIHHDNVSYVFMGSQTHIILNMFTHQSRAFYQFSKLYQIEKIPPEILTEYLFERFESTGFNIQHEICEEIISIANNIPHYVQYLASAVWEKGFESGKILKGEILHKAVDKVLINQKDYFLSIYERLTAYQQKVLKAIQESNKNIMSKEFANRYRLISTSSIQRALERFVKDGILEKQDQSWHFSDPFFKMWLQNYSS